jgi:hypothetical protein
MREGMGWLMDLCPPPEMWALAEALEPWGVLPSMVTDEEDWRFIAANVSRKNLIASWDRWHQMVARPELRITMDTRLIQFMLKLMEEAKEEYG